VLKIIWIKKVHLVSLIVIVHLVFSYYYIPKYWSAFAGFVLILALSYLTWKNKFVFWIGFRINHRQILISVLVLIVFYAGSVFLIHTIAKAHNIVVIKGNYMDLIHTFFYTLNEEIIMGALLLKGIKYRWKEIENWKISVGVAFVFSLVHYLFFKWIFLNSGSLNVFILFSLFCVGILRNNLILKTGHLGYSWAIHFAWVLPMLGHLHLQTNNKYYLTDLERFDLYLGDYRTAIITSLLAIASFYFLNKKAISF